MTVLKFLIACGISVSAASVFSAPSTLTGLSLDASTLYSTTQTSTPAGADTAYNARHRPTYGGALDGVAQLVVNTTKGAFLCSGALLEDGIHVLTAAHCVTDAAGTLTFAAGGFASFGVTPTGPNGLGALSAPIALTSVVVNPGWNGDAFFNGNDLAILTLASEAPVEAARYDIYREGDEIGQVGTKSGWGTVAQGDAGTTAAIGSGWRTGQNLWELTAQQFWSGMATANSSILMYDFDNGAAANDAFGAYFGLKDLGLGDLEVISAPGDSGGPTFIDGKIAGITSFGMTFTNGVDATGKRICSSSNPDVLCGLNSSFGEFGGDTRVSAYAGWIDSVIRPGELPEPSTGWLVVLSVPAAVLARRRRPKAELLQ